jgi:hypothetical protein
LGNKLLIALAAAMAISAPVAAQEDEIVVTGSRISDYERDIIPVIYLSKRADFMVVEVSVESDSREAKLRREEVTKTLEAIAERADRDDRVELGVVRTFEANDDEVKYVEPFTRASIREEIFMSGSRADTTRVSIVVKTPITSADTFDTAYARIERFVDETPETGRAAASESDEPGLSVVDLGKYRAQLLQMIAADNNAVRSVFGDGYRVSISGLEKPVRWRVTGPLELALYFPYAMAASPQ